jgi:hypothetical protein
MFILPSEFSVLCLNFCTKKQEIEPVHTGGGFPEKGVSVQVSGKAALTPDT